MHSFLEEAPLGRCLALCRTWPRGPRKEYLAGLEQGEIHIQWILLQPLRKKESSEWAASIGLSCYTATAAPGHLSWLAVSSSVQFPRGKTLRGGSLILWKAEMALFSPIVSHFNVFILGKFRLWFLITMYYSVWTNSVTGQHVSTFGLGF